MKKRKKLSEKHKRNIGKAMKGRKITWKDKISKALTGRKLSEEHRKKMIGKKPSDETKEKISLAHKGKKASEEAKRKMSETKLKLWKEGKMKGMLGKENKWGHHSQESRIKISAFQQGISPEEWKGFKLKISRFLRNTARTKMWKNLVFLRDDFTCQNPNCQYCHNKKGVYLNAHHIIPLSQFPEFAFDITNGITYCKDFHLKSGLHKGIKKLKIKGG